MASTRGVNPEATAGGEPAATSEPDAGEPRVAAGPTAPLATGRAAHFAGAPSAAWASLILGALTQCTVVGLARFGFGLLLPAMRADLDTGYAAMGGVAMVSFTGFMIGSLLSGLAAVRWGPRRVLIASLALAGVGTTLTGSAPSIPIASFWQVLSGVGGGGSIVASNALATAWFTGRTRGMATGVCVGGSGIGLVAAGFGLPWLLALGGDGWRFGWFALGLPSLFVAALTYAIARDAQPARTRPQPGSQTLPPIGTRPPVQPALLRSPALWWLALVTLCWASSYIVFMTFFGAAGVASGLDAAEVGTLWIALGVLSSWSCIVWGGVSDRLGRLATLSVVYVLHGVACVLLALGTSAPWFLVAAIVFGVGGWGTPALVNAAGADLAGPRLAPAALGMLTLVFGLGQAIGPPVAGLLNDVTGGFTTSSLLAAALLFVGAGLAVAGQRSGLIGRPATARPRASDDP